MSITDVIKRIFGGKGLSRDDESDEQEEFGVADPGAAQLRGQEPEPFTLGAESVADSLDDEFKAPRDPNP
jgi:hypothetical protein